MQVASIWHDKDIEIEVRRRSSNKVKLQWQPQKANRGGGRIPPLKKKANDVNYTPQKYHSM